MLSARCFVPSCFTVYPKISLYFVCCLYTLYIGNWERTRPWKSQKFSKIQQFSTKAAKARQSWADSKTKQKKMYSQLVCRSFFGRWNHLLIVNFYNQHVPGLNVGRSFPWNNHWQAIGARWAILWSLQRKEMLEFSNLASFFLYIFLVELLENVEIWISSTVLWFQWKSAKFYDTIKTQNEVVKTAKPIKLNNCKKNMLRCLIYVLYVEGERESISSWFFRQFWGSFK